MTFDPTAITGNEDNFASKPANVLITPAKYHLEVVGAEKRTSKAGHDYYSVQFRIADDQPFANRRVFHSFNYQHPRAAEIAQKQLAVLIRAGERISGPEDLVGRHVVGAVGIQKGSGDWPDRNDIKFFDDYNGYKCPPQEGSAPSSSYSEPIVDDIF